MTSDWRTGRSQSESCRRCKLKWRHHGGYCRSCAKALGLYSPPTEKPAAKPLPALRYAEHPTHVPEGRNIAGQILESIWHGKDPLPGQGETPRGLGSTLSGSEFHVLKDRRDAPTRPN